MSSLPGLLTLSSDNSTLTLEPFPSANYRAEVHSTQYWCTASDDDGRSITTWKVDARAGRTNKYTNVGMPNKWRNFLDQVKILAQVGEAHSTVAQSKRVNFFHLKRNFRTPDAAVKSKNSA